MLTKQTVPTLLSLALVGLASGMGPGPKKERSLEEMKQDAVGRMLTSRKGVTAWKDVSAEWLPDGRLHFTGAAYFDSLEAYSQSDGPLPAPLPHYKLSNKTNWMLALTLGKDDPKKPDADSPDPKKLSDKELDDYVMKARVKYQEGKAVLVPMLSDYKHKIVMKLPGKIRAAEGFKKDSDKVVSREFDGAAILKSIQQLMARDNAFLRGKMRDAGTVKVIEGMAFLGRNVPALMAGSLALQEVGKDQFDYAKEVKEARASYPMLRQRFNIDKKKLLPGERP